MESTLHEDTVDITCTWEDLVRMDALDMGIYATPAPDGRATQIYMAQRAHWKYDFLLATLEDFEEEVGDAVVAGWQEMDEDARAQHGEEEITITVPRTRQEREA